MISGSGFGKRENQEKMYHQVESQVVRNGEVTPKRRITIEEVRRSTNYTDRIKGYEWGPIVERREDIATTPHPR